jgi:Tol biopolymer transport system component
MGYFLSSQAKIWAPPVLNVTKGSAEDRQPTYSPDSEWILFTSNRLLYNVEGPPSLT